VEDANVKLGSMTFHVLGVSGAMLEAMVEPSNSGEMASHRMRKIIPELCIAQQGI
jgi:hypothetical protein